MDSKKLVEALSDPELHEVFGAVVAEYEARNLEIPVYAGTVAVDGAQSGVSEVMSSPEAVEDNPLEAETPAIERAPLTAEGLLAGFEHAYQTYGFLVDAANSERAKAKGRKKPEQLKVVDEGTVRADVEALIANENVIQELQAEVDYFTEHPEAESPEAGFDLRIVPEGITDTDEQAIARGVQAKVATQFDPYFRPQAYNDKRTPIVTGKGYRLVFAPRHYNVPQGTTAVQTNWMKAKNQTTSATELATATDAEALAFINGLADNNELDNPDTRFHQTYFRRFDQTPHDAYVSRVYVDDYGELNLGRSHARYDYSARALVVPKLKV